MKLRELLAQIADHPDSSLDHEVEFYTNKDGYEANFQNLDEVHKPEHGRIVLRIS